MKKIILASASPRRKEILQNAGFDFEIKPSDFDEKLDDLDFSYEKIEKLAYEKAFSVAKKLSDKKYVVGADTVVVFANNILGKPKNTQEAINMLKMLSGNVHCVVTSICVIESATMEFKIASVTTYVEFNKLSDIEISNYVNKFMPLDKAGAYGIQELPKNFVKKIDGSFENVVGLCPKSVQDLLKEF
ncbi:MAG TPA: Maf family protein [Candidatus Gastranaerophilaceae bacterium]|nr:Maf family protein [Candidatus Gastranaerophilaceae bacterium]HPT40990.1 Maf family protein [Candidatus Gastranaerophilaceae bacterium]